MRNFSLWLSAGVAVLHFACGAVTADCLPHPTAPGAFPNSPATWNRTDSGPILDAFPDLKIGQNLAPIVHGIDLSVNNDHVLYTDVKRCGGEFAILKMDGAFIAHRDKLSPLAINVIPYSYLSVVDSQGHDYKKSSSQFSNAGNTELSDDQLNGLLAIARGMGAAKSKVFVSSYNALISPAQSNISLAGLNGQFVAVDVEETFSVPANSIQRKAFGRFYAAMLSAWIEETKKSLPNVIVLFYTFPDVYTSYLQFAFPAENAVIHGMPIWLARTRGDGSDFDLTTDKNLQRICLSSSGGNRCILHQYSHRATFPVSQIPKTNPPRHIDVDRLFYVKIVQDQQGGQIVRK
jgi:hypothetical protein